MRAAYLLVFALPSCADLIGADFGDASLAADSTSEAAADVNVPESPPPDGGSFDPASLAGLVLWLDATSGVDTTATDGGLLVSTWHDRSTQGHDAIPTTLPGTASPTFVASALNGRPVVHFAAAALQMLQAQWAGPGGNELTMFLVTRGYAMSALRFQDNVSSPPYVILPLDANANELDASFYFFASPVDDAGTAVAGIGLHTQSTEGEELYTVRWSADGTAVTFRDGVLVEQRVGLDPMLPTAQLYIGGVNPGVYCMDGDMAEALVYSVALDDVARQQVEDYLRQKWGV